MVSGHPDFLDELLDSKYKRRIFYFVFSVLLIIVIVSRFFLTPTRPDGDPLHNLVLSVLDTLFATGLVTLVVALLFFWLTPPIIRKAEMDVVYPHRISQLLKKGRVETDGWIYSGGLARFTTGVTIPELAEQAEQENITKEVEILIINPENETVCQEYADYKNGLRSTDGAPWGMKKIQREAIATILIATGWNHTYEPISVEVALKDHFSVFRVDMSSEYAVITKEDPKEPALKTDSGTFFYKSYQEDLRTTRDQSKDVQLNSTHKPDSMDPDTIGTILEDSNLEIDLTDEDCDEIATIIANRENPYGS